MSSSVWTATTATVSLLGMSGTPMTTAGDTASINRPQRRCRRGAQPARRGTTYLLNPENDEAAVIAATDELIASRSYLNGWQTWWLQQPVARLPGFATEPS